MTSEYKVHNIPLNSIKTDYEFIVQADLIYLLSAPVTIKCKINSRGADQFTLNTVSLLQAKERNIERLFLSWTETHSSDIELVVASRRLFGDIGVNTAVVLSDSAGTLYDARIKKTTTATIHNAVATRDTNNVSSSFTASSYRSAIITLENSLDQSVTVKIYGSLDNSIWIQLGSDLSVASSSNDYATLNEEWNYIKVDYQCSIAPSSGSFTSKYKLVS